MELNSYDWNYLFQISPYGDLLGRTNYVLAVRGGKASAHFGAYSNIYILFQMPNRDKADLKPMFENMQFSTIGNLISRNQKQLQKYLLKLLSWKQ